MARRVVQTSKGTPGGSQGIEGKGQRQGAEEARQGKAEAVAESVVGTERATGSSPYQVVHVQCAKRFFRACVTRFPGVTGLPGSA